MKLLIQALEKRRLIMAVRAPRPADRNNHNLAVKLWIGVRNHLAAQVGKAEFESRRRIFHSGLLRRIGRPDKFRRSRLRRPLRHKILLIVHVGAKEVRYKQSPVGLWSKAVES